MGSLLATTLSPLCAMTAQVLPALLLLLLGPIWPLPMVLLPCKTPQSLQDPNGPKQSVNLEISAMHPCILFTVPQKNLEHENIGELAHF